MTTTERWVLYGKTCVAVCVVWMVAAVAFLCAAIITGGDIADRLTLAAVFLFVAGWAAAGCACLCDVVAARADGWRRATEGE